MYANVLVLYLLDLIIGITIYCDFDFVYDQKYIAHIQDWQGNFWYICGGGQPPEY